MAMFEKKGVLTSSKESFSSMHLKFSGRKVSIVPSFLTKNNSVTGQCPKLKRYKLICSRCLNLPPSVRAIFRLISKVVLKLGIC